MKQSCTSSRSFVCVCVCGAHVESARLARTKKSFLPTDLLAISMIRQVLVGSGRRAFVHRHPTSCLAFQDGAYASTSRVSCFAVPLAKEQMLRRGYATDVESQKRASTDATQSTIDQKKGQEKTQASKQADGKQAAEANADEEEQPPSFTTSSSQHFADENLKPLPLLSKPVGVPVAPTSKKLSWAERRELAFDYDRRMEKRKAM